MNGNCLIAGAALLFVGGIANAASFNGTHVRFTVADDLLAGFDGSVAVSGDLLSFTFGPSFSIQASATSNPVAFKDQTIEIDVQALPGWTLTGASWQSGGTYELAGAPPLTDALGFGSFAAKDDRQILQDVRFESPLFVGDEGEWHGLNESGAIPSLSFAGASTLQVSIYEAIRAFAQDTAGAATINLSDGARLQITAAPVPVPAAVWLLGTGLVGLFAGRRRRKV